MFKLVYSRGWISKLFLALFAFSFILGTAIMWGPGGLNFGGGNYIAKVGDIVITPKEYILELNRLQNLYGSNLNREQLKREALNNLLLTGLFAYLAERDNFFVSEEEIKRFIIAQFSDRNGTFHPEYLERYLKALKLTPAEFENMVRTTLLANKYKRAVYSTTYANDATLQALLLPFTLLFEVKVLKLPYGQFTDRFNPGEEELKEFYRKVEKNFVVKVPPRVEIYETETREGAIELIKELKEGKEIKPLKVVPLNNSTQNLPPPFEEAVKRATKTGKYAVVETPGGKYIVALYRKGEEKIPPFSEVKEQLLEVYKAVKATEWMHRNIEQLSKELIAGKYKPQVESGSISGYELLQKFNLPPDTLMEILGGERILKVPTPDGIAVVEILKVEKNGNLPPDVVKSYRRMVRNSLYLKKLGEVVKYVYTHREVPVEVNRNLLERF